jgi:hypothetical protein
LEFVSYTDAELAEFAGNVATSLAKNTAFPNPPVSAADLNTLVNTFHGAVQAALQGGIQFTAAKNAARVPLVDALRKIGSYVQSIANQDQQLLLSSGFYAGSIKRSRSPLEKPVITLVENVATTQLLVRLDPVANARSYNLQISANGNGGWQDAGIYTSARRIVLQNLTPGTMYNIRARAVGGSTGYSEWSDPVARMAT